MSKNYTIEEIWSNVADILEAEPDGLTVAKIFQGLELKGMSIHHIGLTYMLRTLVMEGKVRRTFYGNAVAYRLVRR